MAIPMVNFPQFIFLMSLGFQTYDLMLQYPSTFYHEAMYWGAQDLRSSGLIYTCNGVPLLGGQDILGTNGYFRNTYYALPTHDIILFKIGFYFLDDWRSGDTVIVGFNSRNVSVGDISQSKPYFPSNLCGDSSQTDLGGF